MRIRLLLLAIIAAAVAACGGSGKADHPSSGLERTADGLMIVPPMDRPREPIPDPSPPGLSPRPKRYLICWEREGEFIYEFGWVDFVVHPTQVFMKSSFGPSKTNEVYWVLDITPEQYRAISDSLDRRVNENFIPLTPNDHRDYPGYTLLRFKAGEALPQFTHSGDGKTLRDVLVDVLNRNLKKIVSELNRSLPGDVKPLDPDPSIARPEHILVIRNKPDATATSAAPAG